jgi:hypothetical protein
MARGHAFVRLGPANLGLDQMGKERFGSAYIKLSIVLFEEEENRVPNQAPKPGRLPFKNFQQSLHGTVRM